MRGDYEEIICPFCEKGRVGFIHIPSVVSIRRSKTASLPGNKTYHKSKDIWIAKSNCSHCFMSGEAVERRLRELGSL